MGKRIKTRKTYSKLYLLLSQLTALAYCLPKGRHSDGAHEFQGCSSQKCSRGGVGWVMLGWGGSCRGGVGHAGVGWVM